MPPPSTQSSLPHEGLQTLVDLGRHRAMEQPGRRAYVFLRDGETEEASFTYSELDRRARAIAVLLRQSASEGARVLLLYPPGPAFLTAFLGCLYAGAIAVPAYAPGRGNLKRALPRLMSIASDAKPAVVLTTVEIDQFLRPRATELPAQRWLTTDTLPPGAEDAWTPPAITGQSLAFLQYTSGSTAAPKGVMVSHANLLHNLSCIHQGFGHTPDSIAVTWLPAFHDMGLIDGLLQPLYGGFLSYAMAPMTFLQHPLRWLEVISRHRATHSGGPNFAYDLCVSRSTPEQRAALDLGSWRVSYNGAEPVRHETLERFADAFAPGGFRRTAFYPCYGLAEGTLKVSGPEAGAGARSLRVRPSALERNRVEETGPQESDGRWLVGCGRAVPDTTVAIVDPESGQRCAADEVGEIWVSGPSVARGYWNLEEETARTFGARLAGAEGGFLRTGDLGFVRDGELFVTGRLKDLIILRGRNHYPQDLERTVERSHPALRASACAAFSAEVEGEERLLIAVELDRHAPGVRPASLESSTEAQVAEEQAQLIRAVRKAVAEEHEVQVHQVLLLRPGTLPKTSSGKIQRHACRRGYFDRTLSLVGRDTTPVRD